MSLRPRLSSQLWILSAAWVGVRPDPVALRGDPADDDEDDEEPERDQGEHDDDGSTPPRHAVALEPVHGGRADHREDQPRHHRVDDRRGRRQEQHEPDEERGRADEEPGRDPEVSQPARRREDRRELVELARVELDDLRLFGRRVPVGVAEARKIHTGRCYARPRTTPPALTSTKDGLPHRSRRAAHEPKRGAGIAIRAPRGEARAAETPSRARRALQPRRPAARFRCRPDRLRRRARRVRQDDADGPLGRRGRAPVRLGLARQRRQRRGRAADVRRAGPQSDRAARRPRVLRPVDAEPGRRGRRAAPARQGRRDPVAAVRARARRRPRAHRTGGARRALRPDPPPAAGIAAGDHRAERADPARSGSCAPDGACSSSALPISRSRPTRRRSSSAAPGSSSSPPRSA